MVPCCTFQGWTRSQLFRVRSGRSLSLFFSLYWFCDLGQANSPSESQSPICKMRTLIHFAQCWEFQSQTGKPSVPSKYLVNNFFPSLLSGILLSRLERWRKIWKYIIIEKNDKAVTGSFTYFTERDEKNRTESGSTFLRSLMRTYYAPCLIPGAGNQNHT